MSLDEMVESDDPCRLVVQLVCLLDLSALRKELPLVGAPNYPVEIMLALEMFSKWDGEYSSRRVEKRCKHDVRYRWLCRGLTPDHVTIWRFRGWLGPRLDTLLADSVSLGKKAGLEGLGRASLDGTKLPGAASQWRKFRDACEEADRDLTHEFEGPSGEVQEEPHAQALEIIEKSKKSGRKREPLPPADPDARTMKARQGHFIVGYNAQVLIDRDTDLATAFLLTSEASDSAQLEPTLAKHLEMYGELPDDLLADAGYDTPNNAQVLSDLGIDACVACKERNPFWRLDEGGCPICPMGHPALYKDSGKKNGPQVTRLAVKECASCPLKLRCLPKPDSKEKTISFESTADVSHWIRQKHKARSEEGRERLKGRGTSIEFGFARMKQRLKLKRLSSWGLKASRTEVGIVLLAMNLAVIGTAAGFPELAKTLRSLIWRLGAALRAYPRPEKPQRARSSPFSRIKNTCAKTGFSSPIWT